MKATLNELTREQWRFRMATLTDLVQARMVGITEASDAEELRLLSDAVRSLQLNIQNAKDRWDKIL